MPCLTVLQRYMFSNAILYTAQRFPSTTRVVLRQYLQHIGWMPERARWVVEDLKRRVCPTPSERIIRLTRGTRLEVDLKNAIGRDLYFHGSHEKTLMRVLEKVLKPGGVCIDAGANIGDITLLAAELVGPSGRVFAFEIASTTLPRLRKNIELNRASNVEVVVAAVCEVNEPVEFHLGSGTDSGSSSLTKPHDYCGQSITVPGTRLDDFVAGRNLGRINLIKMDIEGAELNALRGCERLLTAAEPPVIVFEFHRIAAERMGWHLKDAQKYLEDYGYTLRILKDEQDRHERCNVVAARKEQWSDPGLASLGRLFEDAA